MAKRAREPRTPVVNGEGSQQNDELTTLRKEVVGLRKVKEAAEKLCAFDQQNHGDDPSGYVGLLREALREAKA